MLSKRKGHVRSLFKAMCLGAAIVIGGCNGQIDNSLLSSGSNQQNGLIIEPTAGSDTQYRLGTGDKVRLIVYGEPELSGEFVIDGAGVVNLPLIGSVRAKGTTVQQFQQRVVDAFKNGYLNDPKVAAEVLNYRPFFITGEIKQGGQYPFRSGLTVQDSIAIAGGYTYRADIDKVYIRREGRDKEIAVSLKSRVPIVPGDNIRIPERYF
ncbi:MAG: polysaccharide export protein [Alphaproteobacteria bacterium]|nr:polysaccharide export protein [Alphaproteobacteria bacterium]